MINGEVLNSAIVDQPQNLWIQDLEVSKHVEVVPRADDYVVYHKLFGNLCVIDNDGLNLLNSFSQPGRALSEGPSPSILEFVSELKDRFFLVSRDWDERSIVTDEKNYRLANLESGYLLQGIQLILANACNLGCSYCYQDTVDPMWPSPGTPLPVISDNMISLREQASSTKNMSPETAVEVVRAASGMVSRAGNRNLTIEFFGGEPLLNWDAIHAVLDEFGRQTDDGVFLHYSMTTNATRVTDAIARELAESGVTVTVSFDSPVNALRVTKAGGSADHLIKKGLKLLSDNGNTMTFNTVVSIENVEDIDVEGLLETAHRHNVQQIGVILDLDVGPYYEKKRMAKVVDKVMLICSKAPEYGVNITGYWHQVFEQMVGWLPLNLEKGYKTCAAEGCKLSFEPDGSISTCKIAESSIGGVTNIADVFKTETYRHHAVKAYETSPYCKGCAIEGFCSGLCIGSILKTHGDIDGVVPAACEVYRDLTTRLINAAPTDALERLAFPHA